MGFRWRHCHLDFQSARCESIRSYRGSVNLRDNNQLVMPYRHGHLPRPIGHESFRPVEGIDPFPLRLTPLLAA